MILVGVTLLLVVAMAINHVVYGFGCWGLQPGGEVSAIIYDLQILAAVIGILWLLTAIMRRTLPFDALRISAIGVWALVSVALYAWFGWATHTSIHNQGVENLVAYLSIAMTTYLVGRYGQLRQEFELTTNFES